MSSSKTTVRVSSIKVATILHEIEDRLNAIGAHDEAAAVRLQKEAVIRNIGEAADKTVVPSSGMFLVKQNSVIDWAEWAPSKRA